MRWDGLLKLHSLVSPLAVVLLDGPLCAAENFDCDLLIVVGNVSITVLIDSPTGSSADS